MKEKEKISIDYLIGKRGRIEEQEYQILGESIRKALSGKTFSKTYWQKQNIAVILVRTKIKWSLTLEGGRKNGRKRSFINTRRLW